MLYLACQFLSLLEVCIGTCECSSPERVVAEVIEHVTQVFALTQLLRDLQPFLEIALRLGIVAMIGPESADAAERKTQFFQIVVLPGKPHGLLKVV